MEESWSEMKVRHAREERELIRNCVHDIDTKSIQDVEFNKSTLGGKEIRTVKAGTCLRCEHLVLLSE